MPPKFQIRTREMCKSGFLFPKQGRVQYSGRFAGIIFNVKLRLNMKENSVLWSNEAQIF
ncbi:hypothetical protein DCCM_4475 [Desulfocucumis palustris]|uniref:Uncharacterized protein n=1 Tax=Desulfocucumis palustris TaxID=1898651 RepID=A0A2L2XGT8_9FIRM|nr:hypothetical protein DCCM_4475 [Desulfocucumis palustris]